MSKLKYIATFLGGAVVGATASYFVVSTLLEKKYKQWELETQKYYEDRLNKSNVGPGVDSEEFKAEKDIIETADVVDNSGVDAGNYTSYSKEVEDHGYTYSDEETNILNDSNTQPSSMAYKRDINDPSNPALYMEDPNDCAYLIGEDTYCKQPANRLRTMTWFALSSSLVDDDTDQEVIDAISVVGERNYQLLVDGKFEDEFFVYNTNDGLYYDITIVSEHFSDIMSDDYPMEDE